MSSEPYGVVYVIRNTVDGKLYIGQSKAVVTREQQHFRQLNNNTHVNRYLQNAYNAVGPNAFIFGVLDTANTPEELNDKERELIEINGALFDEHGYNLKSGGDVCIFTDDVKQRIGDAQRGKSKPRVSDPAVVSTNISKSKSGENHPMYGLAFSFERCERISNGLKRYNESNPDVRVGIGNGMYGRQHSEETRNAIRQKAIGRKQSDDAITKMVMAQHDPVVCITTGEQFISAAAAARHYGLHTATISGALRKGINRAGKDTVGNPLVWERISKGDNDG